MGARNSKLGNKKSAPPPYEAASKSKASTVRPELLYPKERLHPEIRATDVPQIQWTNSQCREWLVEALVEYCGRERGDAQMASARFHSQGGFGPMLYLYKCSTWQESLGERDGKSIHAMLLVYFNSKGVVPRGLGLKPYDDKVLGKK